MADCFAEVNPWDCPEVPKSAVLRPPGHSTRPHQTLRLQLRSLMRISFTSLPAKSQQSSFSAIMLVSGHGRLLAVLECALQVCHGGQVEAEGVLEALGALPQQSPQPHQGGARRWGRQQLRVVQPHQQRSRPAHQLHLCSGRQCGFSGH